ncbi:hypothetical protein EMQ25_09985 [Arsenicitalea aurantiaca]|uniref:Uncharacterized protein n=1 Tax=Arsenicitalea aurantiaca TaxID=1783274 RepID=A0A433XAT7_9HYPH|nr:DUF6101 family protein [Arsenicitalea aurantiaca]RUT31185.1 hypothetical protein EMQ25_09985 [Arsenicitalea aurantiaca]
MVRGVAIEGSTVIMMLGAGKGKGAAGRLAPRFGPANDNGPKDPVNTVTVRKMLEKSGVAIKIKVPVTEYVGVAVSTSISAEGQLTSAIELIHGDPELNYRVFEEEGNHNVVAEWQNWGRKLRLPLFIRAGDGSLLPYSQQVDGVALGNATGRRKLAAEAGRRPRFLNRRKTGTGETLV